EARASAGRELYWYQRQHDVLFSEPAFPGLAGAHHELVDRTHPVGILNPRQPLIEYWVFAGKLVEEDKPDHPTVLARPIRIQDLRSWPCLSVHTAVKEVYRAHPGFPQFGLEDHSQIRFRTDGKLGTAICRPKFTGKSPTVLIRAHPIRQEQV